MEKCEYEHPYTGATIGEPHPKRLRKYQIKWGVYHPKYNLINTASATRRGCMYSFCGDPKNWKYWYRQGWRIVPIEVYIKSEEEK